MPIQLNVITGTFGSGFRPAFVEAKKEPIDIRVARLAQLEKKGPLQRKIAQEALEDLIEELDE